MKQVYGTSLLERNPGGQPGNKNAVGPHDGKKSKVYHIGIQMGHLDKNGKTMAQPDVTFAREYKGT
jgi:hypothetical protein